MKEKTSKKQKSGSITDNVVINEFESMSDDDLSNTFFKESGVSNDNTKTAFINLVRVDRENALKLLRERRKSL